MSEQQTIDALAALSQATRLQTFRLLVGREPEGVPAGELARLIGVPVRPKRKALGKASRILRPRSPSCVRCASSTITMMFFRSFQAPDFLTTNGSN